MVVGLCLARGAAGEGLLVEVLAVFWRTAVVRRRCGEHREGNRRNTRFILYFGELPPTFPHVPHNLLVLENRFFIFLAVNLCSLSSIIK